MSEKEVTGNPETRITVEKEKAMQYGLTVAQVYSELATELQSETSATTLTIGADDVPVVVIKDAASLTGRDSIMQYTFTVTGQDGEEKTVELSEIATKTETDSVPAINRENNVRTMSVTAGVDEEHNIGLVSRELQKTLDEYEVPDGYTVTLSGENETINSAMLDLLKMMALAIVFIYLIMVAQFQSLMSPFIVMFTIPLAFTGGLLALLVTVKELSIIAMLGFLVLSGVVVNLSLIHISAAPVQPMSFEPAELHKTTAFDFDAQPPMPEKTPEPEVQQPVSQTIPLDFSQPEPEPAVEELSFDMPLAPVQPQAPKSENLGGRCV